MPLSHNRITDYTDWAPPEGATTVVEPSNTQKAAGFAPLFQVPAQWVNWFWKRVSDWSRYFDDSINGGLWTGADIIDTTAHALLERVRGFVAPLSITPRTLLFRFYNTLSGGYLYVWSAWNGTDNTLLDLEITDNATWDGAHWQKSVSNKPALMVRFSAGDAGVRIAYQLATQNAPWNDSYALPTSANWNTLLEANSAGITTGVTVLAGIVSAATTLFANSIKAVTGTLVKIDGGHNLEVTGTITGDSSITAVGGVFGAGVTATNNLNGLTLSIGGNGSVVGSFDAGSGLYRQSEVNSLQAFPGSGSQIGQWGALFAGVIPPTFQQLLFRPRAGTLKAVRLWVVTTGTGGIGSGKKIRASVYRVPAGNATWTPASGIWGLGTVSLAAQLEITDIAAFAVTTSLAVAHSASDAYYVVYDDHGTGSVGGSGGANVLCLLDFIE